jgi:hypothetical protein
MGMLRVSNNLPVLVHLFVWETPVVRLLLR